MQLVPKARALADGRRRVVGGKGQGRGVRSDGAMAMGCGLQGRSAWGGEGAQGEGRGIGCERLGTKALRGLARDHRPCEGSV